MLKLVVLLLSALVLISCAKNNEAIDSVRIVKVNDLFSIVNKSTTQIIRATYFCEYSAYAEADAADAEADAAADASAYAEADAADAAADASAAADDGATYNSDVTLASGTNTVTLEPGEVAEVNMREYVPCIRAEIRGARFMEDKYIEDK